MAKLKKRIGIVVGASRGLGRAIALSLASEGATLALLARHTDQLEETAKLCRSQGGEAFIFSVDVTDQQAIKKVIEQFLQQHKKLDLLILCQGIIYRSFLIDDQQDQWRQVLEINLLSSMYITRLCLPYITKENKPEYSRAIIYISSIAGKQTSAGISAYCASKYGLIGFAHCIFEEIRKEGVKVAVICPGYINTSMVNEESYLDPQKMIQPEDLAKLVTEVILSPPSICPVEIIARPQLPPQKS